MQIFNCSEFLCTYTQEPTFARDINSNKQQKPHRFIFASSIVFSCLVIFNTFSDTFIDFFKEEAYPLSFRGLVVYYIFFMLPIWDSLCLFYFNSFSTVIIETEFFLAKHCFRSFIHPISLRLKQQNNTKTKELKYCLTKRPLLILSSYRNIQNFQ
ncbi:hypothetical protein SAMN05421544_1292 [Riemerella columbipharyngis]|uniref:Uncharacterized protein n=1 Tax=Riemerella columbipharyngis TaxID=1071918 RepID=A0A1G7FW30_9FLAO|nr:hypothetical protein SAMN05421544_1292 [Riemerella columbipharyngis]